MSIGIFHKSAFEPWDWRTPDTTGIGGSEIAQIEIGRRLAKRGFDVTQYANVPNPDTQMPEGIFWEHWKDAVFEDHSDWIIMRAPGALDGYEPMEHQSFSLLCEDVVYSEQCGGAFTPERTRKFDRIIGLCPTHIDYLKKSFRFISDKVVLSGNGIKSDVIGEAWAMNLQGRDQFRLIWASSPDRGLKCLLQIFRRAKELEPRLSLHCYYGFDNWDKVIAANPGCPQEKMKAEIVELLDQPGVHWHGRRPQMALWTEFARSSLWVYPTWFPETSCITCMEAQALGAIPITTPYWAVGHNVKHGVFIPGDPTNDKLLQARYADWIVRLTNNPEVCERIRNEMMPWARETFSWERIVDQYEAWFSEVPCAVSDELPELRL